MARAFAICTQRDITVMSHAEDMEISPWDYRLAEDIETVRNCWLSEYYQTKLHMCHVSTRGAIEAIQMAKLRGAPVTCEVTPHHLWFTNDTCDYRVNPPIRTADDVQALIDGIRSRRGGRHRHRPRPPLRGGQAQGHGRHGGQRDGLRRLLHQALQRGGAAAGAAEST